MKGGRQVVLQSPYLVFPYQLNFFPPFLKGPGNPSGCHRGSSRFSVSVIWPDPWHSATPIQFGTSRSFQEIGTCAWLISFFELAHLRKRKKSRLSCTIACLHYYFLYWHLKDWFRIESEIRAEKLSRTGPTLNLTASSYADWFPSSQMGLFQKSSINCFLLNFYFIDTMLNFLREILFSSFITAGTPPVNGRAKWPKNLFGFQQKYQEAKHCPSSNLTNSGLEA